MALIAKIPDTSFTNLSLPKLYRDAVITPGTLFCYDFADPTSWVKQANSASGDVVKNLVDGGEDAALGTTALSFSGGGLGGFGTTPTGKII